MNAQTVHGPATPEMGCRMDFLIFDSKSWLLNLKFESNGFEFQTKVLNLLKNKNVNFGSRIQI
jgi:hypothetical protein